jgi:plastocyanin
MQLTSFTLSALCVGSALAQQTVRTHVVRVGSTNPEQALTYMPSELTAEVGDMVQFQFAPKNHTVTQSTFDKPCEPALLNSNITGIYSGFMPVAADSEMTATYTIRINNTAPLWLYCSQGRHCQSGMVMVINAPAANQTRTLANYKALAASAPANLPGDAAPGAPASPTNGSDTGSPTESGTPTESNNGGSGADGNNGGNGGVADPSGTATPGELDNTAGAGMLRVGQALVGSLVVAMGFAVLM